MIEIPTLRPEPIGSLESDFGTTIATSIWEKTINNHAWVERNLPIGFCLQLNRDIQPVSGPALSDPNPDIWQFLDGTLISDADSPLNGVNVPDCRNRFLKHKTGVAFSTGGASTLNISHGHAIGFVDNRQPDFQADNDNDRAAGILHNHPVTPNLSSTENIIPLHIQYHIYVRYK